MQSGYDRGMDGAATPPISLTATVLVTLLAIFAASWAMFWALVRRWTLDREWVALSDWGRDAGFRMQRNPPVSALPHPLSAMPWKPSATVVLSDRRKMLLRLQSLAPLPPTTESAQQSTEVKKETRWNVAVRPVDPPWPPTGLRPTGAATSFIDLFPLSSFPLLGAGERFMIFGTDSGAAATLSASSARALLPPDIGLLLHGNHLYLDFSGRPFDSIEFERMLVIADQIVLHLPVGGAG